MRFTVLRDGATLVVPVHTSEVDKAAFVPGTRHSHKVRGAGRGRVDGIRAGPSLGNPSFVWPSTALKDRLRGPQTANRQPPTANRQRRPTATHQPLPTATNHQSPTTNRRQPPPTANRRSPSTTVGHSSYTRYFRKTAVSDHFFFSFSLKGPPCIRDPPPPHLTQRARGAEVAKSPPSQIVPFEVVPRQTRPPSPPPSVWWADRCLNVIFTPGEPPLSGSSIPSTGGRPCRSPATACHALQRRAIPPATSGNRAAARSPPTTTTAAPSTAPHYPNHCPKVLPPSPPRPSWSVCLAIGQCQCHHTNTMGPPPRGCAASCIWAMVASLMHRWILPPVLEVTGGYWRLLEVTGGCWRLLEVTGGYWRSLEVSGGCWRLLDVTGGYWRLLEVAGGYWRLLEVTGGYWRLLEVAGGYWRLLEVAGG